MKFFLVVLVLFAVECSNQQNYSDTSIPEQDQSVVSGTLDCSNGAPVVKIDPGKYIACIASVKRSYLWVGVDVSCDFEKGEVMFNGSRDCGEFRLLLW